MGWLWVWYANEQRWWIRELDNIVVGQCEWAERMNGVTVGVISEWAEKMNVWSVWMSRDDEYDKSVTGVGDEWDDCVIRECEWAERMNGMTVWLVLMSRDDE
jgi:hypothetical protein